MRYLFLVSHPVSTIRRGEEKATRIKIVDKSLTNILITPLVAVQEAGLFALDIQGRVDNRLALEAGTSTELPLAFLPCRQ